MTGWQASKEMHPRRRVAPGVHGAPIEGATICGSTPYDEGSAERSRVERSA